LVSIRENARCRKAEQAFAGFHTIFIRAFSGHLPRLQFANARLPLIESDLPLLVSIQQEPFMAATTELHVNGTVRRVEADPDRSLLSVLRDDLDLTGSKYGCGEGKCGACTVLIDGKATRSCVTAFGDCDGKQVTTIEGLEREGRLHPLQEAFLDAGALQCGYCTAGMIMSGVALLNRNPEPTTPEIVRAMEGNICRCGTYARIMLAVRQAGASLKGGGG
jgi:aerobic-type carbon monoxide dehydrogenase small subunit (CoxS/CutS family)